MFAIAAIVIFLLAAFGPNNIGPVELVPLGLACLGFALLVGNWPVGYFRRP